MADRATRLADALWRCIEARNEEKEARDNAAVPDSWDYFGHRYFEEIERADKLLAAELDEILPVRAAGEGDTRP